MPELVTHAFSVYFIGMHPSVKRVRWLFYFGVLLPDVISRPIYILWPRWFGYTVAMHTPIFMLIVCLLLAEFFASPLKIKARWALLAGCGFHFLLDLFQKHIGAGYFWLFPFSWRSFEIGLFWPEATLPLVPIWLLLMVAFEGIWLLRRRKSQVIPGIG